MKRRVMFGVVAAAATVFVPVSASADTYRNANCSDQGYRGYNRVLVSDLGSAWRLRQTEYNFQPTSASSTHNNQNYNIHSGGKSISGNIYSRDDLLRDSTWRPSAVLGVATSKGSTFVYFYDIFDVPQVNDPECGVNTTTF